MIKHERIFKNYTVFLYSYVYLPRIHNHKCWLKSLLKRAKLCDNFQPILHSLNWPNKLLWSRVHAPLAILTLFIPNSLVDLSSHRCWAKKKH